MGYKLRFINLMQMIGGASFLNYWFVDLDMNQGSTPMMPRYPARKTLSLAMLPQSVTAP